jgi:hypothetical protein
MRVDEILTTGILDKRNAKINLDIDSRMRILANLMIDKILESKKLGLLGLRKSEVLKQKI